MEPTAIKKLNRNKTEDLKKLANAFYNNLKIIPWELGGIGLDPKRPFGGLNVYKSMLEIINWKPEGNNGCQLPRPLWSGLVINL